MMTTYDEVLHAAEKLPIDEKARLLESLSAALRRDLMQGQSVKRSLLGMWTRDDVSAEDIDSARREMWDSFPREDI